MNVGELWAVYVRVGTLRAVQAETGIGYDTVRKRLVKAGYRLKKSKFNLKDDQKIIDYYAKTPVEIFDLDELTSLLKRPEKSNVCRRARELGLTDQARKCNANDLAGIRERAKGQWNKRQHPRGALGLKHSDATKKIISEKSLRYARTLTDEQKALRIDKQLRTSEKNGTLYRNKKHGSWRCGWATVGDKRNYYRSMWELNYARYLQFQKEEGRIKDWRHEPKTFWFENILRGVRSYLPDFEVTYHNDAIAYHEVKGWMDDKSRVKIQRMAKYYPEIELIVIAKDSYDEIRLSMKHVLDSWDDPFDKEKENAL